MIAEGLTQTIVTLLAETIWQEVVVTGITARFKEEIVRKKISDKISESLQEALTVVPDFEANLDEISLIEYFNNPTVSREVRKLLSPSELIDVSILRDEWIKKFPKSIGGKVEILLNGFLNRLKKSLWKIQELHEALFRRGSLSYLSHIASSVDNFSKSQI